MTVKGDKGDKGDTGAQGVKGDKGDKGDTGAQGPKGENIWDETMSIKNPGHHLQLHQESSHIITTLPERTWALIEYKFVGQGLNSSSSGLYKSGEIGFYRRWNLAANREDIESIEKQLYRKVFEYVRFVYDHETQQVRLEIKNGNFELARYKLVVRVMKVNYLHD